MAGTLTGGIKARDANYARHGKDFYKNIGRKGGLVKGTKGGFAANPGLASIAGKKGGQNSRRGKAKVRRETTAEEK